MPFLNLGMHELPHNEGVLTCRAQLKERGQIRHSASVQEITRAAGKTCHLPLHQPKQEVLNRWNSIVCTLEGLLKQ